MLALRMEHGNRNWNGRRLLVGFERWAFRPPIGEAEAGVCESKNHTPDSNPKQTVPKQQATEASRKSVLVGDRPIFGDHSKCVNSKRVEQRYQALPL